MTDYEYVKRRVKDLIPYINNSRTHSDEQVSQIASSIKEFGFTNPVLIDEQGGIIAGHGRIMAAKKLGIEDAPCIVLDGLTEAQKKAYIIADNQLPLNAGWDLDKLKIEIETLNELDFDIDLLGFDDDFMAGLMEEEPSDGLTDEDEVPEVPENPVSVLGDIWQLGDHRLMCGDSTSIDAVEKLMDGGVANMTFTDPPYLMDFKGNVSWDDKNGAQKTFNAVHGGIKNDKMSKKEGEDFLDAINSIILQFTDGAFYITFYRLGIDWYYASMNRVGMQCRSLIVWGKGNHTLSNSDYMSCYEPMFYGWVNNHKFYGGKNGMDIWRIKRTKKNDLHPTMKPVELVEKALDDGSQINGVVLDLFGGSGTTMIAAEIKRRHSRLMELDEKYVDVIINRWQNFTGKEAVHIESGKTFSEMSNDREK